MNPQSSSLQSQTRVINHDQMIEYDVNLCYVCDARANNVLHTPKIADKPGFYTNIREVLIYIDILLGFS